MKIRIERLEIELPGLVEELGTIVLGQSNAERAAAGAYNDNLYAFAQRVFDMLTTYLKETRYAASDEDDCAACPMPATPPVAAPTRAHSGYGPVEPDAERLDPVPEP